MVVTNFYNNSTTPDYTILKSDLKKYFEFLKETVVSYQIWYGSDHRYYIDDTTPMTENHIKTMLRRAIMDKFGLRGRVLKVIVDTFMRNLRKDANVHLEARNKPYQINPT